MQKASNLAATIAAPNNSQTPYTDTPMMPKKWIAALFLKLQSIYGHRWTVSFQGIEEMAMREWAIGLADMTPEAIRRGIDNLNGEWPPTLPEFKKLCTGRAINEFGLDYVPQCYRETRHERLLDQPRDEEAAKRHLAEMRAAIGGAR